MPRFVLLLHECERDLPHPTHCDLMLERGETLETWALAELPYDWQSLNDTENLVGFAASNTVVAERLADHRIAYLDYEGPVSGDRGTVRQIDSGTFVDGQASGRYELNGQVIRGEIELHETSNTNQWQLKFTPAPS